MDNNFIIRFILLDNNNIERDIRYMIEDLEKLLLHNFYVERRSVRQKSENYYEHIISLYTNLIFKEHFRMSPTAVEIKLIFY